MMTLREIGEALGVPAATITGWRRRYKSCPRRGKNGESLKSWQKWCEENGFPKAQGSTTEPQESEPVDGGLSVQEIARLDKEAAYKLKLKQIEVHDEKLKVMRGQYVPREEVENELAPLIAGLQAAIEDRDTSIASWAGGRTTPEIRERLRSTLDDIFRGVRDNLIDLVSLAEKKAAKEIALEPTGVNLPGAGRPTEPGSRRQKRATAKAKGEAPKKSGGRPKQGSAK